jgi:GNAT superfamily N-acetyltransferase
VAGVQLPAPGVAVRPGRPTDAGAAELVFAAASSEYACMAGSAERARRIVASAWARPGHSASFEHALVAEVDGRLAGVLIAFPARRRYRLHLGLLRTSIGQVPPRRWPLLAAALPALILASPRPPRDSYYVGTTAVAPHARRRDVASTLAYHAERAAAGGGFPLIVAHTGSRHAIARRALERYGFRPLKERRNGYVLYSKVVEQSA